MKEIIRETPVTISPPETYNPNNISYWEPTSIQVHGLRNKNVPDATKVLNLARRQLIAENIVQDGITPDGNKRWRVGKFTVIYQASKNRFICDCNALRVLNDICGHSLAVRQWEFMKDEKINVQ